MRYVSCPYDPKHYATALRIDGQLNTLTWDCSRGQDAIIIQTPFGVSAQERLDELCAELSKIEQPLTDYVEIEHGVWACYVSAANKVKNCGCRLNGEASTYTVFGCVTEGDVCKVFQPQNQAMIMQSCNVPLDVCVSIHKVTRTQGWGPFKREVDTGFYRMDFSAHLPAWFRDGSVCYRIGNLEIPVTRKIIENRVAYIKANKSPELVANDEGIAVKIVSSSTEE